MKTILIFPPVWECSSPYPSLAVLSAYLKSQEIEVDTMDLNIEIQHYLFSKPHVMEAEISELKKSIETNKEPNFLKNAKLCIWLYEQLKKHIKIDVVSDIHNSHNEVEETKAKFICNYMKFIYSARFYPARFSDLNYSSPFKMDNITEILKAVEDQTYNIFYEVIKENFLSSICEYDIVGLSMASFNQMIPGLTLAKLIKTEKPGTKIILGGAIIPYIENAIYENTDIFKYIDYIITGEGETALTNCIRHISGDSKDELSNLFFYDRTKESVVRSEKTTVEKMDELPCPDYSQYPLDKYFCRKVMLSYVSSRGCFWNKCSFCSLTSSYGNKYRERNIRNVIKDLIELERKYKTERISFNDEALTAKRITDISKKKLQYNLNFYWSCLARFNNYYNEKDLKLAYDSGLRMMSLGLESGSQHVLDGMNKGIKVHEVPHILNLLHKNNIWTNVYFIIGFPNETEQDFMKSIEFLKQNEENIDSLCYTYFRLEDKSQIINNPDNYQISICPCKKDYFGPSYDFVSETITLIDLEKRYSLLSDTLRDKKCYTYNVYYDFDAIFSFLVEGRKIELESFIEKNISLKNESNEMFKIKLRKITFWFNDEYDIYDDGNVACVFHNRKYEMYTFNKSTMFYLALFKLPSQIEDVCKKVEQQYEEVDKEVIESDIIRLVTQLIELDVLKYQREPL